MINLRRSVLGIVALASLALGPVAAVAQAPAPLQFAPAGTKLTWQNTERGTVTTRVNTIRGMDGRWPTFQRDNETQVRRWVAPGCWNCDTDTSFNESAYMALWPLSVGKSVTVARQSTVHSDRRWQDTIRVARTETVTVPAGRFETFVIETQSRGLHNQWSGTQTVWFAPSLGWSVKSQRVEQNGPTSESVLAAVQRP